MYIKYGILNISKYIFILDNSSTDGESCSDVDDDFTEVDDSLLCDSVNFANGTTSTPYSKRQRTSGVQFQEPPSSQAPRPVAPPVPTTSQSVPTGHPPAWPPVPTEQRPAATPPTTMSVTNSGHNTMFLTSSDGNTINMGDVMSAMMMQIHSVNKLVSKQEESETSRKRRIEETEVLLFYLQTKILILIFRTRKKPLF